MDEEAGGSSQNAGQPGDVLSIQPQLVAAVTEQVLQALSNENKRGEKRRKRQQKGSDSKRQRAQVHQVQILTVMRNHQVILTVHHHLKVILIYNQILQHLR